MSRQKTALHSIVGQAPVTAISVELPIKSIDLLLKIENGYMSKNDLRLQLFGLEFPVEVIIAFCGDDAVKEKNILKLWSSLGETYPEYFQKYIDDCIKRINEYQIKQELYLEALQKQQKTYLKNIKSSA